MSNPFLTITCPDKDGFIRGDIYDLSLSKMQGFMRPSVRRKGDIADNLRQISRLTSHRDVSTTGVSESQITAPARAHLSPGHITCCTLSHNLGIWICAARLASSSRALNEPSQRFYNHGEGHHWVGFKTL